MERPARGAQPQALGATAVILALLVLYIPVFTHAVEVWTRVQEFSFAFVMPPISLGMLWLRRQRLLAAVTRGVTIGLVPLACGLLLLLAGTRSGVHAVAGAAFFPTALGIALYLYGSAAARIVSFPVAFLTVSLCLYSGLLNSLGFALQRVTAAASADLASLLGTPVHRSGVDLFVGQFHFVVAEACSGMSSLLALLCLGTVMVALAQASMPRRLLLMAAILPITLIANTIRVTLVLLLARPFGLAVAEGFLHGALSGALFLSALALFFLMGRVLGCYPRLGPTSLS